MKNFYRVYEFSHICSERDLPDNWKTDENIVVQETTPTGTEIVSMLENDLESANYHGWTGIPAALYKIILDRTSEHVAMEIMTKIYEKGVFEV